MAPALTEPEDRVRLNKTLNDVSFALGSALAEAAASGSLPVSEAQALIKQITADMRRTG